MFNSRKKNVAAWLDSVLENLEERNRNLGPKTKKLYAQVKIKKQPFF